MKPQIVGKRVEELIKSRNISVDEVAQKLKISVKQLENKIEGKEEFYVSEVIELTEIFDLDIKAVSEIFFNEKEQSKSNT